MNRNLKHQLARRLCCFLLCSTFCISASGQTNHVLLRTFSTTSPSGYRPENSASGSTNPITVTVPGSMKIYRLFKP